MHHHFVSPDLYLYCSMYGVTVVVTCIAGGTGSHIQCKLISIAAMMHHHAMDDIIFAALSRQNL